MATAGSLPAAAGPALTAGNAAFGPCWGAGWPVCCNACCHQAGHHRTPSSSKGNYAQPVASGAHVSLHTRADSCAIARALVSLCGTKGRLNCFHATLAKTRVLGSPRSGQQVGGTWLPLLPPVDHQHSRYHLLSRPVCLAATSCGRATVVSMPHACGDGIQQARCIALFPSSAVFVLLRKRSSFAHLSVLSKAQADVPLYHACHDLSTSINEKPWYHCICHMVL